MNDDMLILLVLKNLCEYSVGFLLGWPQCIPVFDGMIFACLLGKGDNICPISRGRESIWSWRFSSHLFVGPDQPADVIFLSQIDVVQLATADLSPRHRPPPNKIGT